MGIFHLLTPQLLSKCVSSEVHHQFDSVESRFHRCIEAYTYSFRHICTVAVPVMLTSGKALWQEAARFIWKGEIRQKCGGPRCSLDCDSLLSVVAQVRNLRLEPLE